MIASLKKILAPPVFEDEEKTRKAALLNMIVLAAFLVATLYLLAAPVLLHGEIPFWALVRYPLIIFIWVLLRRGYVDFACSFALTSAWIIQMFAWANTGGSQATSLAGTIIFVLIAGLLIGNRAAYLFAAMSVLAIFAMIYGESRGFLPTITPKYTPAQTLVAQASWSFLAAILLHLSMSRANQALKRANEELAERKRIEVALRASEERFTKIFHASPLPITIGVEGQVLDVNDTFLKTSGYSREEVISHTTVELNIYENPEDRFKVAQLLKEQGRIQNLEINFRVKSGEVRANLLSAEIIELGGQQCVLMVANDITERKRVEAALRLSEEKFAKIFNASPLPTGISSEGRILDVNDVFLKTSGYSRAEVIGRTTEELRIYETSEDRSKVAQLLSEEGAIHNLEINFRMKSGEVRAGLLSAETIELDGRPALLMVANDISERKQVEEALRASEERFSRAFNASPISMIMSKNRHFIDVNHNFLSITNYTFDEIIGHTADELRLFVDRDDPVRIDQILAEQGAVHNHEVKLRTKTGEIRVVLYSAEIIELGGQASLLGAVIDITESKRLEDQLRQSQKLQAIGQLAGGVAHDFNNILTVIIAFSELLLREIPEADSPRRKIGIIKDSGIRAAKLTQQLLAFSRQQVMEQQVLSLNSVVKEILEMLERLIGENIELRAVFDSNLKMVKADQGQLEQVILNLVANARDAMPRGGKLTIETANINLDATYAKQNLEVSPGWYAMLAVSDTGIGMDTETLGHIFEPFFTTKEKEKGTGLGLATVHGIVKQSGGHVSVYSEPEQGTTFKIYLPHTEMAEEKEAFTVAPLSTSKRGETVLLVEDEASIKEVAREILQMQGYVVLEANSEDAIAVSDEFEGEIHLLLTDVVMPKMNGRELAEHLSSKRHGLKVLYMSGYTDNVIVHHGILKPHIAFLQKPFTSHSLAEKVRAVLDG